MVYFFQCNKGSLFVNSKTILSEGNIVIKDGQRSKTMFLEEMRNEGYLYIEIFEIHHRQLLLIKGVEVTIGRCSSIGKINVLKKTCSKMHGKKFLKILTKKACNYTKTSPVYAVFNYFDKKTRYMNLRHLRQCLF